MPLHAMSILTPVDGLEEDDPQEALAVFEEQNTALKPANDSPHVLHHYYL